MRNNFRRAYFQIKFLKCNRVFHRQLNVIICPVLFIAWINLLQNIWQYFFCAALPKKNTNQVYFESGWNFEFQFLRVLKYPQINFLICNYNFRRWSILYCYVLRPWDMTLSIQSTGNCIADMMKLRYPWANFSHFIIATITASCTKGGFLPA